MCLKTVTKKVTPHKYGYKIFTRLNQREFSSYFRYNHKLIFKMNKWIEDPLNATIMSSDRTPYQIGFHYLLQKPKLNIDEFNNRIAKHILALVEVDNVVATGTDEIAFGTLNPKAGVCKRIRIVKILQGKLIKQKIKKYKFPKNFKTTLELYSKRDEEKIKELLLSSMDTYIDFIVLVDRFPRNSSIFKFMQSIHLDLLKNNKTYYTQYLKVIYIGSPESKKLENHEFSSRKLHNDKDFMFSLQCFVTKITKETIEVLQ